jgi:hypothetical protein
MGEFVRLVKNLQLSQSIESGDRAKGPKTLQGIGCAVLLSVALPSPNPRALVSLPLLEWPLSRAHRLTIPSQLNAHSDDKDILEALPQLQGYQTEILLITSFVAADLQQ